MECICVIKDIYKAITSFEESFLNDFNLCINEALVLCCLKDKQLSSSELAEQAGLKFSHASKIIKSIEDKGLIKRTVGHSDKRYMNFELSTAGQEILKKIESNQLDIPELLRPVFNCRNQPSVSTIN